MRAAARDFPSVATVRVRDALEPVEALTAKLALAFRSASGVALAAMLLWCWPACSRPIGAPASSTR